MAAPTFADIRDIMIFGISGIMAVYPPSQRPVYKENQACLLWPSGAKALLLSAEEPERFRGKECQKFAFEELCACRYQAEAWLQLQMGNRQGDSIQGIVATTPKPTKLLKQIMASPSTVITRGSSYDNRNNLTAEWYRDVIAPLEGTRMGRQEIHAEILEAIEGALWDQERMIDPFRVGKIDLADMAEIVVAIDPAVSVTETSDETGIIAAARGLDGFFYVLDDGSDKYPPNEWAKKAIELYHRHQANYIVAEVNQGGDMVANTIRMIDKNIKVVMVHASRGKQTRAEPVSTFYEQGKGRHVGCFPKLEEQLTTWVPGAKNQGSPDRLDALVWCATRLMLDETPEPSLWIP